MQSVRQPTQMFQQVSLRRVRKGIAEGIVQASREARHEEALGLKLLQAVREMNARPTPPHHSSEPPATAAEFKRGHHMPEMKQLFALTAVLAGLAFPGLTLSQSGFWKDSSGRPMAETESMKSKDDFAGSVLVTVDEDWKEKWNTPPQTTPSFRRAEVVPYGKKVFVLIFFTHPRLDAQGNANVQCDLQITTPAGEVTLAQKNVTCHAGKIRGSLYNVYLAAPVIAFSGDPGDPVGTWEVKVALRDANRGVELPLRTTFGLSEK